MAVAVVFVVILGEIVFLVLQVGDDGRTTSAEEELPCTERAANDVVSGDRFAQDVRDLGTVPPLSDVLEIYDAKLVGCADLTGDEVDEMVVRLLERGTAPVEDAPVTEQPTDSPTPWAIYVAEGPKWTPALVRPHVATSEVAIEDDVITERSPGLAEGDPLCCPSGQREGEVRWDGEGFVYRFRGGPRGSTIALTDGEPAAIAGFDLRAGGLSSAAELFGPPSSYAPEGEVCPARWEDLGLTIEFADPGGADPCGGEATVATARVEGPEAEQAGWRTQDEATVGTTEAQLRKLYPEMEPAEETTFVPEEPVGQLFTLVDPSLSARVDDGEVVGLEVSVSVEP